MAAKTLLVIGGHVSYNWYELFDGAKLHDVTNVKVETAHWDDIQLVSYSDAGVVLTLAPAAKPIPGTNQDKPRTIRPDFVLFRSAPFGVIGQDWRNTLIGLVHSRTPCINSAESMYMCLEKPVIYGKLLGIHKTLKQDFPLIPQAYHAGWKSLTFSDNFPCVAKIGTAHAGFGKMKIQGLPELEDFRSVVALQSRYVTLEPFIDWDYDFRIQKIGSHYRAFRRFSTNWKGKGMSQHDEDIPVTPQYKQWIDLAAEALGMDICALDGVHSKTDDKEYILELNDSAIGLVTRHKEEDLQLIKELVLFKMSLAYPASTLPQQNAPSQYPIATSQTSEEALDQQLLKLKIRVGELEKQNAELKAKLQQKPLSKDSDEKRGLLSWLWWW